MRSAVESSVAEEPFQVGCRTAVQGDEVHAVDAGIDVDGQVGMEPGALGRTFGKLIDMVVEGNVCMPGHPVGLGRGGVVHRIGKSASGATELLTGMVLSNEPGYYQEGCDGIRCENLMIVVAFDDGTIQTIKQRGSTDIWFPRDTLYFPTKSRATTMTATDSHVYVGNAEGMVFIARVEEPDFKLENIESATYTAFPESSVTALQAVMGGSLSSKVKEAMAENGGDVDAMDNEDSTTTVLLAGSDNGEVKQYEIIPSQGGDVTHWPRLKTQKLKKRAHTFKGNSGKVTSIVADHAKIITACEDGTVRFYNPRNGRECSYTMDGLDGITQMSLGEEVLVTNGMQEGFICLHDFGIIDDSIDFGTLEVSDD